METEKGPPPRTGRGYPRRGQHHLPGPHPPCSLHFPEALRFNLPLFLNVKFERLVVA